MYHDDFISRLDHGYMPIISMGAGFDRDINHFFAETIGLADGESLKITCAVKTQHKTGVEMEALVGASMAALTVYDMCKALSHDIEIGPTRLMEKRGGKNQVRKKS